MAGSYEINKSSNGQFRFVLKAGNGEIILTSELYKAKSSALKGIAAVQKHAAEDNRYDRLVAKNGQFYFNLKSSNHKIVGTSEMYPTEKVRDAGIDSVKKNGALSKIKDNTVAAKKVAKK